MSPAAERVPVAILAAGEGSRLARAAGDAPKPCRRLLGRSLAEWSLASFLEAGIEEFAIVVGYRADQVADHYRAVAQRLGCLLTTVEATGWRRGNGVSALAAARHFDQRPFLLAMADHLFSPALIRTVLAQPPVGGEVRLAVDPQTDHLVDLDDLTKVRLEGDRIVAVGKQLESWDAGDTGLFYCTQAIAEGLERAQSVGRHALSDGVGECAARGVFRAIVVGRGERWMDIDTPRDFAAAERRGAAWLDLAGQ